MKWQYISEEVTAGVWDRVSLENMRKTGTACAGEEHVDTLVALKGVAGPFQHGTMGQRGVARSLIAGAEAGMYVQFAM